LYLFHGGYGDDSDYVNFSNIIRYADEHKLAVIMPSGYNSGYSDDNRMGQFRAKYWEYIFEELPLVCAAMFPISTKREDTFVGGLSMGAVAAAKMAIYGSDRCSAALLMSGIGTESVAGGITSTDNFQSDDGNIDIEKVVAQMKNLVNPESKLYRTAKTNAANGKALPKFFMTCGGDDFLLPAVHACRDLLRGYGYDVVYDEVPGYGHEWSFWDLSLCKALNEWLPLRHDVIIE